MSDPHGCRALPVALAAIAACTSRLRPPPPPPLLLLLPRLVASSSAARARREVCQHVKAPGPDCHLRYRRLLWPTHQSMGQRGGMIED